MTVNINGKNPLNNKIRIYICYALWPWKKSVCENHNLCYHSRILNVNVLLLLPRSNNLNDLVKIFVSLFYIKLHTTCFHSRTFKKCMLHMLSPHVEHQMVICQSWEENLIKSLIPKISVPVLYIVCHTFLISLALRLWCWIKQYSPADIFYFSLLPALVNILV